MTNAISKQIMQNGNTESNIAKYTKGELSIQKCKLRELKLMAKYFKLRISGTKPELISRVKAKLIENKNASIIQALFRGHLVRFSIKLRGCALRSRSMCVNDSNFYTLEPVHEIDVCDFYSYTDTKGFVYGFSISSLILLFKQKGHITNPYNREKMDFKTMNEIFVLYKLNNILHPIKKYEELDHESVGINQTSQVASLPGALTVLTELSSPIQSPFPIVNTHPPDIVSDHSQSELRTYMSTRQSRPIQERISELFMEMDQLGNYTNETWFTNLDQRGFYNLFNHLFDIWEYRAQLSRQIKNCICSLEDPFYGIRFHHALEMNSEQNDFRLKCLYVMEHMVYTGVDVEYQKLGTLHVLSAFTIVSLSARTSLHWLYESLMY